MEPMGTLGKPGPSISPADLNLMDVIKKMIGHYRERGGWGER